MDCIGSASFKTWNHTNAMSLSKLLSEHMKLQEKRSSACKTRPHVPFTHLWVHFTTSHQGFPLFVSYPPSDRPHLACHRAATAWPSQVVLQLGNFHLLIELPPPFWGRYRFQEDHLKSTVHPKEKILKWSEFEEKHMDFPKKDATKLIYHSSGTVPNWT